MRVGVVWRGSKGELGSWGSFPLLETAIPDIPELRPGRAAERDACLGWKLPLRSQLGMGMM